MKTKSLTDLQLDVMRALWTLGEGGVADIHEALREEGRELAPTTVATLLQRLERQGWVAHKRSGRQFVYRARITQKSAAKGALRRLLGSFFGGRASALTAQLLESEALSSEELGAIRKLLDEKEG